VDRAAAGSIEALAADAELLATCLELHRRLDLRQQLQAFVERSQAWTGAEFAIAFGPGEDRRMLAPVAGSLPEDDPRLRAVRGVRREQANEWIGEGARAFEGFGPFAALLDRWPGAAPRFSLALPLRGEEELPVAFVLALLDAPPAAQALERLGKLLEAARPAVRNAVQVQAMRDLVIKDDTAQCFNRRYFETTLPVELSRASRFHAPLSLIFLDMDNLKEVNTLHGHAMGSRTLLEVSRRIRGKIRRFDKLFRFGGDEFCIVLPETNWRGALEVAERVRDAIADRPFLLREVADTRGVRMTASLGIASFPLHARNQQALIEHADRAMQRIKSSTKNSIGVAEVAGGEHGD
jgi:diguanylate cyclase (GGDEF)-like protein